MGKKRLVMNSAGENSETKPKAASGSVKKRIEAGILFVQSTYNNTKLLLADKNGNALAWGSSGAAGFRGAKKGTPFAAAKVGENLAVKAQVLGLKEIDVVIKGVGSGRESAVRGFIGKGFIVNSIKDETPVPHNGPTPKKPRRV
ncbi:30S ribosomal protein S11 [Patescibacteria group bacterium]|nr:30S ribosomal protein S11 [Patescibacteria group bacterium]MDE1946500.1 30S ribosomal protein S11 [Patescibacteria group bacterium]MDE2011255.1 30S ribosomal protein S11 [Patescibacteria group bacterium]MDE2233338.1 30S ribosomal protein S11 [Patescibacteria group bacterium]